MRKLLFISMAGVLVFNSCLSGKKNNSREYSISDARAAKAPSKEKYLKNYVKKITNKPVAKSFEAICEERGDYGIPAKLPDDPKLLDFLSYSADHYRTSYLMLGKESDRKNTAFEWQIGALKDLWIYYGNEDARKRAEVVLKYAVRNLEKMTNEQIRSKIDKQGLKNFWHPLMKNAAWYYAQLYELTGDERYAQRACLILERFGEVFGKWPVHFSSGTKGKKKRGMIYIDKKNPPPIRIGYGFWGWWGDTLDLKHALPLLKSWTIVKDSKTYKKLSPERRRTIRKELLELMVEKHLLFKFKALHNQNMCRIEGLTYFGIYLQKPEYIHQAARWISDMLHIGYRRDGMWCEGTLSYAAGVTKGIFRAAKMMKGWSDPEGYKDPIDGKHFTNFDVEKEFGTDFKRIKNAFDLLALPDGRSIAFEDTTWNDKGKYFTKPPTESIPFLLGESGAGMLGFGKGDDQVRLYLHWEGINNHDHSDTLGIALWACGEEIASETGYRGLRAWNKSTAAHNTVVVDESDQGGREKAPKAKNGNDALKLHPQYKYGELWGAQSIFDDAGDLTLWNTTEKDVQVAQVNAIKSYKGIKKYQRSLVLVKVDEKRFYILDVFEINGKKTHDWMLHGNLAKRYKIKAEGISKKLTDKDGRSGKYLDNLKAVKWSKNFTVDFIHENDPVLRTIVAGSPDTEVIFADGPAIRLDREPSCWGKPEKAKAFEMKRSGKSEFLCVRRKGPENVFVAIHEAFRKKPCVKDVEFANGKICIKLKNREDVVEIKDGLIMYSGNGKTIAFGAKPLYGDVIKVTSVDRGDVENSFIVTENLPDGEKLKDEILFIYDGDKRPHPYIISRIKKLENNMSKIITEGETGMLMENNLMVMTYYPSWDIAGKLTYKISGKQTVK